MMYEEDRENRNNSEAGCNDRNDEHMEYRSNESRNTDTQEVRREQHFAAESGQSSSETCGAQPEKAARAVAITEHGRKQPV